MEKFNKVAIIGSGYVGSTIAYAMLLRNLADKIILIDTNSALAEAEKCDIAQGFPQISCCEILKGSFCDTKNADLIVVTAGRNRHSDESRLDLAKDNARISISIAEEIKKYYTKGIILIVSNPVDIITYIMTKHLNLPEGKIFGTGCILDSSRFITFSSEFFQKPITSIKALVVGEHGSSQVALWNSVVIDNLPINEFLEKNNIIFSNEDKNRIEEEVKNFGTKIIKGKDRTHFGISSCVCYITEAILNNSNTIISVSKVLKNEHGLNDVALSLPCIINADGVCVDESFNLSSEEKEKLKKSANTLKSVLESISDEEF